MAFSVASSRPVRVGHFQDPSDRQRAAGQHGAEQDHAEQEGDRGLMQLQRQGAPAGQQRGYAAQREADRGQHRPQVHSPAPQHERDGPGGRDGAGDRQPRRIGVHERADREVHDQRDGRPSARRDWPGRRVHVPAGDASERPGRNGASSSGKSTLAKAIQGNCPKPFLHVSPDHLVASGMLPVRAIWMGRSPGGSRCARGSSPSEESSHNLHSFYILPAHAWRELLT
jgi:hypothetical protein